MTLQLAHSFTLSSLTANAYASATNNAHFAFDPRAKNYAIELSIGSISNTAQIAYTLDHASQNPDDVTPNWSNLLAYNAMTNSGISTVFEAVSTRPLMPYGRFQVIAKAGSAAIDVKTIVGKVLTELY